MFGFLNDISIEVLIEDRFVCSVRCCIPLSFSEYHISGVVKGLGQRVVYKVLLSRYAVPNEYAGSGSVIQLVSFLFRNVDKSQVSEHTQGCFNDGFLACQASYGVLPTTDRVGVQFLR